MRLIDADHFLKTLEQTVMDDKADPSWRKIANAMQFMVNTEVFFFPVTKTGAWEGPENGYYHCTNCKKATKIPRYVGGFLYDYCPNCGANMRGEEDG